MNIFYLDKRPDDAAEMHCDKHCVKMILEYAQMLSTAHRELDVNVPDILYKSTHKNHPSTIWTRSSKQHYDWLFRLFRMLSAEYSLRYSNGEFKVHKSWDKLGKILEVAPKNIKDNGDLEWNTQLEKMDIDVNSAKKIWEDAINLIRGPCPVPGVSARKICDWCKDFTYPSIKKNIHW